MRRWKRIAALGALLCGCAGQHELTVFDTIAPAGGTAAVVVRLQRSEVDRLMRPVKDAALLFDGPLAAERAAFTDAEGYAGIALAAPSQPGRYPVAINYKDRQGHVRCWQCHVYVFDPKAALVAVDAEALPVDERNEEAVARSALTKLAEAGGVIYFAPVPVDRLSSRMSAGLVPDGPVVQWERESWRIEQEGKLALPRVVVEKRMISPLGRLLRDLPGLKVGIAGSAEAARAFAGAGMDVHAVCGSEVALPEGARRATWRDLAPAETAPEGQPTPPSE